MDINWGLRLSPDETRACSTAWSTATTTNSFYDVSSDGERFLMVRPYADDTRDEASAGWVLVRNFFEVLKARVPN